MKFEEQFPSLNNKTCVVFSEHEPEYDANSGNLILIKDFEHCCIDNQVIIKAIDKVFNVNDEEYAVHNKMIKKELGLYEV